MRRISLLAGAAALGLTGAVGGILASASTNAQSAPESLLPPGFDDPAPAPIPTPRPAQTAAPRPAAPGAPSVAPPSGGTEVVQPLPGAGSPAPVPTISGDELSQLPSLEELENLSPDELDEKLGLKPKFDIPPAARRSMREVGLLSPQEGGLPTGSLARQPASLVRAALAGTRGPMVSRWGHILLRRALASRLEAPEGMNPVEFAALRAATLNRIGEFAIARALVQDVDTGNWNKALTDEAITATIATFDVTGICPAVRLQGSSRKDPQWVMLQAICNAYAGEGALAGTQLDRALGNGIAPPIDILLAQRYAGAAGRGRRAVEIEWDDVDTLDPWRFALAGAVGEPVPAGLLATAMDGPQRDYFALAGVHAVMLPPGERVDWARLAAERGVLSSQAMIDLYSMVYADRSVGGEPAGRAAALRDAYVATNPGARIAAMQRLWGEDRDYSARVSTAYAAARIPASEDHAPHAGNLIASMLAAGLDRDAAAWRGMMADGSLGWALLAVGIPGAGDADFGALDTFADNDETRDMRATAFLVAGLAGLGRIDGDELEAFEGRLDIDLSRQTRWTRVISRAAEVDNAALVALLAGLGMQGSDWSRMTPLHLYHIVAALRAVGMDAEARMIAAEAVARA